MLNLFLKKLKIELNVLKRFSTKSAHAETNQFSWLAFFRRAVICHFLKKSPNEQVASVVDANRFVPTELAEPLPSGDNGF